MTIQKENLYFNLGTYLGPLRAGEDLGLLLSKPSIHPGSGTNARFTDELLTSRPPANHLSACLNGIVPGWVGEEGRCGGGQVVFILVVALPTLEGIPLLTAFLITSGVFQAFILACSVKDIISSKPPDSTARYRPVSESQPPKECSSSSRLPSIRGVSSSTSLWKKKKNSHMPIDQ